MIFIVFLNIFELLLPDVFFFSDPDHANAFKSLYLILCQRFSFSFSVMDISLFIQPLPNIDTVFLISRRHTDQVVMLYEILFCNSESFFPRVGLFPNDTQLIELIDSFLTKFPYLVSCFLRTEPDSKLVSIRTLIKRSGIQIPKGIIIILCVIKSSFPCDIILRLPLKAKFF